MHKNQQRKWTVFWACFCAAFMTLAVAQAATVRLVAFVGKALLDTNSNILADGSLVQIIGSSDSTNNGFYSTGNYTNSPTTTGSNLWYNTTQGDDVILGSVTIAGPGSGGFSNGTFFTTDFTFDSSQITYMYIRFFDYVGTPVTGLVNYGYSEVLIATNIRFGILVMNFGGGEKTTNWDNFVAIPEPSTVSLLLLAMGLITGFRASMKKADGSESTGPPTGVT
ncbi:MAG: PEP-CTERM sorting domain-containing protein [Verrucomicrobia bacterium]|nr:PEP-CTERM sorting domain-containing protein [Verrucomicrobiota bacterium]